MRRVIALLVAVGLGASAIGCSSDTKPRAQASQSASGSESVRGQTITLVTHDAFAVTDSVLKAFSDRTGITVNVVKGGDAGAVVNQAILTKDHPQGDVLYGIDNTLLSKGLDAGLFDPYVSPSLSSTDRTFDLDAQHRITPVDESDVCVNYDKRATTVSSLDDLRKPEFKDKLVVENPATSSTGLAFLVATVAKFGEDHYLDYWRALKANGVKVDDGWDQAYNNDFTLGSGGTGSRSVVVSYATSPPADALFATPPKTTSDVGSVDDGCFRQIEFVGVLKGTSHSAAAHAFIDFMLSKAFQEDMPEQMFVYPVRTDAALPELFTSLAAKPAHPVDVPQDQISANREKWIRDWTAAVLG
ncbi:MAG TPA: thiamine ABC transporter substrate-binding protein [Acidimicrobiales bacterium]|jgi:thiamine transport system substrate-binding protein|nr:thiamine ABC transporter substrate-binding protein [Acidimicrobiales bacterium]